MFDWLKKEETNTSRQYNLDLLKALAIVCMIICHCVTMIGAHHDGYENDFPFGLCLEFLSLWIFHFIIRFNDGRI